MRILAKESGVGLSSIYHFFGDKDDLLKHLYNKVNRELGVERAKLVKRRIASDMMYDRIVFQFEHIQKVVFVLKYYLHFRKKFLKLDSGFIPTKAYLHIEEVLEYGNQTGEFDIPEDKVAEESKVIAHAINGFLLEYYPDTPNRRELKSVCTSIHHFLLKSLTNKEAVLKD